MFVRQVGSTLHDQKNICIPIPTHDNISENALRNGFSPMVPYVFSVLYNVLVLTVSCQTQVVYIVVVSFQPLRYNAVNILLGSTSYVICVVVVVYKQTIRERTQLFAFLNKMKLVFLTLVAFFYLLLLLLLRSAQRNASLP